MEEDKTYRIVRFYQRSDVEREQITTGLTLEEAQEHCNDPEISGVDPVKGPFFDGYYEE